MFRDRVVIVTSGYAWEIQTGLKVKKIQKALYNRHVVHVIKPSGFANCHSSKLGSYLWFLPGIRDMEFSILVPAEMRKVEPYSRGNFLIEVGSGM